MLGRRSTGLSLYEAFEFCIAASFFSDSGWKEKALDAATLVLQAYRQQRFPPAPEAIRVVEARLRARKIWCSMSHDAVPSGQIDRGYITFPPTYALANAFYADLALLWTRQAIQRGDFDTAHEELAKYTPIFGSTFKKAQQLRIKVMQGAVYRFQGRFQEAYETLKATYEHHNVSSSALVQLSAVLCELREADLAVARVRGWLNLRLPASSRANFRARLALADAYLVCGLQKVRSGQV